MRLRTRIQAPERFEDEDYNSPATNNSTKPAFPRLLKERTTSFDQHLPPAAFPSLTQAHPPNGDDDRLSDDLAEPADVDMMDIDRPFDHTLLPIVRSRADLGTQTASVTSSSGMQDLPGFERSFLGDAETSDEEEEVCPHQSTIPVTLDDADYRVFPQIQQSRAERTFTDSAPSIHWTQLALSVQVEIFENICDSCYGYATYDILGLTRDELYDVMKHLWTRNKQVVAEDQGIQVLQQAQLRAILRKDHSSRLRAESWRDHVAHTRRHLPHITARLDYFICNEADVELARMFLNQRGIDTRILGVWGRNEKDNGVTNWIQTQAEELSASREGIDSGYISEVTEQGPQHVGQIIGQVPPRNALSDISNRAFNGSNRPSSLRRKRPQSLLAFPLDTVTTDDHVVAPTAPAALQFISSTMSLRAHDSHLTQNYEEAMALMRTRGGGFDDSDVSYDDEHEPLEIKSPPWLKNSPPKPPRDKVDLSVDYIAISPGQRTITLKISPQRLEKFQKMNSSDARPSTIKPSEILVPPTLTSAPGLVNQTPKHASSRPQRPLPAVRAPLTSQDQGKPSAFSLKLLEVQRGAAGAYTPPTFLELPTQLLDRQTLTSPKRLKLNPPQDNLFSQLSGGANIHTSSVSSQLQRNDSTSSQEAPPWSPITQRLNSLSRPPSRKASHKDEFKSYTFLSIDSSDSALQSSGASNMDSMVLTAPQTPQQARTPYVKPSIAENGSPAMAFKLTESNSSVQVSDEGINEQANAKVRPHPSPQTPRRLPNYAGAPSQASISGLPIAMDSLRVYGSSLFAGSLNNSQSSPSRQLTKSLAGAVPATPASAENSDHPPPSISPTEQSRIDILFSFQKKPHAPGEKLDIQVPGPGSTNSVPSSKKQSLVEEDDSPTGGQASSAKKASEALEAATVALQESTETKFGKDGKARPRTYVKSEMQRQKEATNAAAKAAGLAVKRRATKDPKIDAKGYEPLQTVELESTASHTTSHIEAPLREGEQVEESGPFVKKQEVADSNNAKFVADLLTVVESSLEPLEVVKSSKQKPSESGNPKAQKVAEVATGDESYAADETSDMSIVFKKIAIPKGKRVAVDRAKVAVEGYQTAMAMRGKIGKSALTDMAPKNKSTLIAKTVGTSEEPASKEAILKPNIAAEGKGNLAPMKKTTSKAEQVESQDTPSLSEKVTLNVRDGPGNGETPAPAKRTKKISGLWREFSALSAEGQRRTKAFRGNQYLKADGTPQLNADGTPRTRKERARPGK